MWGQVDVVIPSATLDVNEVRNPLLGAGLTLSTERLSSTFRWPT
jgi:hypothetical protein